MQNFAYIITGDGNITLVFDAKNFSVGKSHRNYSKIVDAIKAKEYDRLDALIDLPATITAGMNRGTVTVKNGEVFYRGKPMHNTVTERILAFIDSDLPFEPLMRFLENLLENPMPEAVNELYDFLENTASGRSQFPITEDGCFIGYKGVNDNYTDRHTGMFDNTPNITEPRPGLKLPKIPREEVDPDRRNECSHGLHVGTLEYARGFGARVVLVKVNPRDCIAVPQDHNYSKLRVCQYEVLAEAESVLEHPMYPMPQQTAAYNEDEFDGDYNEDFEDDVDTELTAGQATHVQTVKTVKRKPCSYCGAKGGKRHAKNCYRPKRA